MSRPFRNMNPGNLRAPSKKKAQQWYKGVLGLDDTRHVRFATWEDGIRAVRQDVRVKISGRSASGLPANPTIAAFSQVYAEDQGHAVKLGELLGMPITARIGLDVQEAAFIRALVRLEGGTDTWEAVQGLLV